MLCACIGNADETAIVQACGLHTEWARLAVRVMSAKEMQTAMDRVNAPVLPKATR